MSLTNSIQTSAKNVTSQLRTSIIQALSVIFGAGNVITVTDSNVTLDRLEPSGTKLTIRYSIDIQPKDPS